MGRRTHHPTNGNKNKDQLEDKLGDKASGRRAHHPRNGNKKGNKLEGGHQREQEGKTTWQAGRQAGRQAGGQGGQVLGKASNKGKQKGRQWEIIQSKGGRRTIQQRETRRDTRGDKTSGRRTHMWGDNDRQLEAVGDIGNKGRQDGKAGIPSNRGTQEGRPCETSETQRTHM